MEVPRRKPVAGKLFLYLAEKHELARKNVAFLFVDCDVNPDLAVKEGIAICKYSNGSCVYGDVLEEQSQIADFDVAQSFCTKTGSNKPDKRGLVRMVCPGSLFKIKMCEGNERTWSCRKCLEKLEFGFDDHFYCACGKASCNTFEFKCNSVGHVVEFERFDKCTLTQHLRNLKPYKELNILLLGETGVGKSTWINGFANYLSFATMDEAMNNDVISLIPTSFVITGRNFEQKKISTGMDKNENSQALGQSATQFPKTYTLPYGETLVRLIDTPGIGDTRGIEKDKENFQNIMSHLSCYDEVHGICILLKPNNARLTVMFKFCIKELLTHLHRDACRNIVFCFTNSRSTFYRPGDTMPALQQLVSENKEVVINLSPETVYCIDNEAVRFLAAFKQGIVFSDKEQRDFSESWETSVTENRRLIDFISHLTPHKIKNTLSLNDSRRIILALTKPLAEMTRTIQNNISVLMEHELNVMTSKQNKEELAKNLNMPVIDLKIIPLNYPMTVCTAPQCVTHVKVGNISKTDYSTHCHPRCGISGTEKNTVNCVALQQCAAMAGRLNCQKCGCSWKIHMHITYDCERVETQIIDENVRRQITDKDSAITAIEQHVINLRSRVSELEIEQRKITEVCAQFAWFLKTNAIAPYNDALGDYLNHLIDLERGKVGAGGSQDTLKYLENTLSLYQEEIRILVGAMEDQNRTTRQRTPTDVRRLIQNLCEMKLMGMSLSDAIRIAESTNYKPPEYSEHILRPRLIRRDISRTRVSTPGSWFSNINVPRWLKRW